MEQSVTARRPGVEKAVGILLLLALATPVVEALAAVPGAEETAVALKRQWLQKPALPAAALAYSGSLLTLGRREEACRVLLSTYALAPLGDERDRLRDRVRVVSRAFQSSEAARQYQAGVTLLLSGDDRGALARFEAVLASEHGQFDALVRKGQVEFLLQRADSAAETFRLARTINPFETEVQIWLGKLLMQRGERDLGVSETLEAWKNADAEQRSRPHWKVWHAEALVMLRRIAPAREILESALPASGSPFQESSGWYLSGLATLGAAPKGAARRFLNMFPAGYRRIAGRSGLGLDWWNPAMLETELEGRNSAGQREKISQ